MNEDHPTPAFIDVDIMSMGKNPPKNEDAFRYNESVLVLSDGATDKSGQDLKGQSGGKLAAELVVDACLASKANGADLVNEVSEKLKHLYEQINPKALQDSAFRFAATLLVARIVGSEIIITQVGDSSFRINGIDAHTNSKLVDQLTANARREYIKTTGDIDGGRDFIMPLLKNQHLYQNNATHPLGYEIIDGTPVPEQMIKVFRYPIDTVQTIELVTDGYYNSFPETVSIDAYEALRRHIKDVDPYKFGEFTATKLDDDRTVLIATLKR